VLQQGLIYALWRLKGSINSNFSKLAVANANESDYH